MGKGLPRKLRLSRTEERRVAAVLSTFPRTAPEISIRPHDGQKFEVDFSERLPFVVGAEEFSADYDARTREFEEANCEIVSRRIRVNGVWCFELYSTGGAILDVGFRLCWQSWDYYHMSAGRLLSYDSYGDQWMAEPTTKRLPSSEGFTWLGSHAAQGPADGGVFAAGYNTLEIDGRAIECMHVISVRRPEKDPDWAEPRYPDKPPQPEWDYLGEYYVNREGRNILSRCHRSTEEHGYHCWAEARFRASTSQPEGWPEGLALISYNGVGFYHWFDTVTDAAL